MHWILTFPQCFPITGNILSWFLWDVIDRQSPMPHSYSHLTSELISINLQLCTIFLPFAHFASNGVEDLSSKNRFPFPNLLILNLMSINKNKWELAVFRCWPLHVFVRMPVSLYLAKLCSSWQQLSSRSCGFLLPYRLEMPGTGAPSAF